MSASRPLSLPGRLIVLDTARTLAVVCMVIYHFTFDLALFGRIPSDTMSQPFWYYSARMIAGSFLFLSGLGLWLAHGQGIRWQGFWLRWAKLVAAATLVTAASIWLVPGGPIWFGILHALAATGLIGLIVLRLPWPVTLALAALVFAGGWLDHSPAFDGLALVWVGLAETRPMMGDYVPLLPWAAPALAGIAFAKALSIDLWRTRQASRTVRHLTFPGRHSLIIYLVHQPLLFGMFNAWLWITAP